MLIKNRNIIVFICLLLLSVLFFGGKPVQAHPHTDPVVTAVKNAAPAVVNISAVERASQQRRQFGNPFFDDFFDSFFDRMPRQQESSSLGSGVIIDGSNGYVLTNHHVVAQASRVTVTMADQTEYPAVILGTDPASDLAVLQIQKKNDLPTIKMGKSDELLIGQKLIAIGNPFGLSHTVTTGVLSAKNRTFKSDGTVYFDFIQTDAAINPGNSGGALLDESGQLIGINTAIFARAEGIGFAIPINKAKRIAAELIKHGRVRTAWVGLDVQTITAELKDHFKAPQGRGVVVTKVEERSPASKAGLKRDDIVLSVGEFRVTNEEFFNRAIADYPPGHSIKLTVYRNYKSSIITLNPVLLPPAKANDRALSLLGFLVKKIDSRTSHQENLRLDTGVEVSKVLRGSPAARIGLRTGDVLLAINDYRITNPTIYGKVVAGLTAENPVTLVVQRNRTQYRVTIRPGR